MFFSVVIPVYNVEKYLNECVDSILSQTFTDFELILVDDGSKDDSGKICDEYAQKDERVKVIHKTNGGQSSARNLGIEQASGRFIVFLDSDDFISTPDYFMDIKNTVKAETQIVIFRYKKYYTQERQDDCNITLANISYSNKGELLEQLVKRDSFFCSCWSKCVSSALLKENGIRFDESLCCEDMDWYYSVVEKAEYFEIIDKPYVNYRQRENSVTTLAKPKVVGDYVKTLSKWSERFLLLESGVEKEALLSSLAKLYCNLLITYARNKKVFKEYKKAVFIFKYLLQYNMNPRTKTIYRFSRFFGLNLTCLALKILDKARR